MPQEKARKITDLYPPESASSLMSLILHFSGDIADWRKWFESIDQDYHPYNNDEVDAFYAYDKARSQDEQRLVFSRKEDPSFPAPSVIIEQEYFSINLLALSRPEVDLRILKSFLNLPLKFHSWSIYEADWGKTIREESDFSILKELACL